MSVQKRGVSLSDSTFHMNEGSSFRSLNTEMSGDNSVGAIGPIFDPSAQQVGSKDSHTAGSEHSFGWTTLHKLFKTQLLPQMAKRSSSTRGFVETLQWHTWNGKFPKSLRPGKTVFRKYGLHSFGTAPVKTVQWRAWKWWLNSSFTWFFTQNIFYSLNQLVVLGWCLWSSAKRAFLCCEFHRDSTGNGWEGRANKIKSISNSFYSIDKTYSPYFKVTWWLTFPQDYLFWISSVDSRDGKEGTRMS